MGDLDGLRVGDQVGRIDGVLVGDFEGDIVGVNGSEEGAIGSTDGCVEVTGNTEGTVVGNKTVGVKVVETDGICETDGEHFLESYSGRKLLVENGWITP